MNHSLFKKPLKASFKLPLIHSLPRVSERFNLNNLFLHLLRFANTELSYHHITLSKMCFSTLPNSTAGGLLLQDCTRVLYQTKRRRPWRGLRIFLGGSGYQTLRWGAFTTRLYEGTLPDYAAAARWMRLFESCCGRKWGASVPTFFNYQTARGERQNNKIL